MKKSLTPRWLCGFVALMGLSSCEEVIELDLGNADPRIVIEGTITTDEGPYRIKIGQSVDYGEKNEFPPLSGATVTVRDKEGTSEVLEEVDEGIYLIQALQGKLGYFYDVEVNYEGEAYKASTTMPTKMISLQSLEYIFEEESLFTEEGYYLTAFFADPEDEVNYYRLKIFVNGEPYYFERDDVLVKDDNFWLINDKFFNGRIMDYDFPHKLKVGDRVDVELHQVDRATFEYYRTLLDVMGIGGVAPSNPLTNWSNGALGYFGAISVTYASTVIEDTAN